MRVDGHGPVIGRRLGRRALAAAVLACAPARAASPLPALPAGGVLDFRILRDGSEVGSHRITFERHGTVTVAQVAIDIAVRVAWVTVYRFALRGAETWEGNRFRDIESHSDDNGHAEQMRAVASDGAPQVSGTGTVGYRAPPSALASTYWNPAMLAGPTFSAEDGKLCAAHFAGGPEEDVPALNGPVRARRYERRGEADMDVWYDLQDQWAHLRFRRSGSLITYLRA